MVPFRTAHKTQQEKNLFNSNDLWFAVYTFTYVSERRRSRTRNEGVRSFSWRRHRLFASQAYIHTHTRAHRLTCELWLFLITIPAFFNFAYLRVEEKKHHPHSQSSLKFWEKRKRIREIFCWIEFLVIIPYVYVCSCVCESRGSLKGARVYGLEGVVVNICNVKVTKNGILRRWLDDRVWEVLQLFKFKNLHDFGYIVVWGHHTLWWKRQTDI